MEASSDGDGQTDKAAPFCGGPTFDAEGRKTYLVRRNSTLDSVHVECDCNVAFNANQVEGSRTPNYSHEIRDRQDDANAGSISANRNVSPNLHVMPERKSNVGYKIKENYPSVIRQDDSYGMGSQSDDARVNDALCATYEMEPQNDQGHTVAVANSGNTVVDLSGNNLQGFQADGKGTLAADFSEVLNLIVGSKGSNGIEPLVLHRLISEVQSLCLQGAEGTREGEASSPYPSPDQRGNLGTDFCEQLQDQQHNMEERQCPEYFSERRVKSGNSKSIHSERQLGEFSLAIKARCSPGSALRGSQPGQNADGQDFEIKVHCTQVGKDEIGKMSSANQYPSSETVYKEVPAPSQTCGPLNFKIPPNIGICYTQENQETGYDKPAFGATSPYVQEGFCNEYFSDREAAGKQLQGALPEQSIVISTQTYGHLEGTFRAPAHGIQERPCDKPDGTFHQSSKVRTPYSYEQDLERLCADIVVNDLQGDMRDRPGVNERENVAERSDKQPRYDALNTYPVYRNDQPACNMQSEAKPFIVPHITIAEETLSYDDDTIGRRPYNSQIETLALTSETGSNTGSYPQTRGPSCIQSEMIQGTSQTTRGQQGFLECDIISRNPGCLKCELKTPLLREFTSGQAIKGNLIIPLQQWARFRSKMNDYSDHVESNTPSYQQAIDRVANASWNQAPVSINRLESSFKAGISRSPGFSKNAFQTADTVAPDSRGAPIQRAQENVKCIGVETLTLKSENDTTANDECQFPDYGGSLSSNIRDESGLTASESRTPEPQRSLSKNERSSPFTRNIDLLCSCVLHPQSRKELQPKKDPRQADISVPITSTERLQTNDPRNLCKTEISFLNGFERLPHFPQSQDPSNFKSEKFGASGGLPQSPTAGSFLREEQRKPDELAPRMGSSRKYAIERVAPVGDWLPPSTKAGTPAHRYEDLPYKASPEKAKSQPVKSDIKGLSAVPDRRSNERDTGNLTTSAQTRVPSNSLEVNYQYKGGALVKAPCYSKNKASSNKTPQQDNTETSDASHSSRWKSETSRQVISERLHATNDNVKNTSQRLGMSSRDRRGGKFDDQSIAQSGKQPTPEKSTRGRPNIEPKENTLTAKDATSLNKSVSSSVAKAKSYDLYTPQTMEDITENSSTCKTAPSTAGVENLKSSQFSKCDVCFTNNQIKELDPREIRGVVIDDSTTVVRNGSSNRLDNYKQGLGLRVTSTLEQNTICLPEEEENLETRKQSPSDQAGTALTPTETKDVNDHPRKQDSEMNADHTVSKQEIVFPVCDTASTPIDRTTASASKISPRPIRICLPATLQMRMPSCESSEQLINGNKTNIPIGPGAKVCCSAKCVPYCLLDASFIPNFAVIPNSQNAKTIPSKVCCSSMNNPTGKVLCISCKHDYQRSASKEEQLAFLPGNEQPSTQLSETGPQPSPKISSHNQVRKQSSILKKPLEIQNTGEVVIQDTTARSETSVLDNPVGKVKCSPKTQTTNRSTPPSDTTRGSRWGLRKLSPDITFGQKRDRNRSQKERPHWSETSLLRSIKSSYSSLSAHISASETNAHGKSHYLPYNQNIEKSSPKLSTGSLVCAEDLQGSSSEKIQTRYGREGKTFAKSEDAKQCLLKDCQKSSTNFTAPEEVLPEKKRNHCSHLYDNPKTSGNKKGIKIPGLNKDGSTSTSSLDRLAGRTSMVLVRSHKPV